MFILKNDCKIGLKGGFKWRKEWNLRSATITRKKENKILIMRGIVQKDWSPKVTILMWSSFSFCFCYFCMESLNLLCPCCLEVLQFDWKRFWFSSVKCFNFFPKKYHTILRGFSLHSGSLINSFGLRFLPVSGSVFSVTPCTGISF